MAPSSPRLWRSATFYLTIIAAALLLTGTALIFLYAFNTPGSSWSYAGVGMLTASAALLSGNLAGFLLGVPKMVSSGQVRAPDGSPSPNTNLSDISDWITKLLLGAGLVSLTHLGRPIGRLIDNVASGLYAASSHPDGAPAAKALAGAILVGFTVLGLLAGYVLTSTWYPEKLERLAAKARKLAEDGGDRQETKEAAEQVART